MASPLHQLFARANGDNTGDNRDETPVSASGLVATLVPVLLVSVVMVIVFMILRRTQRRQYAPRTFVTSLRPEERTPELPSGLFNWIGAFSKIPDSWVLNHQSIDGYLLLRFLKISTIICLVGCCITFPILFPVNATAGGTKQQLDILGIANVPREQKNRLFAHALVGWLYFGFIWYMIAREHIYYINIRQAYLLSPLYARRMSSRTVLFTSVPNDFLDPNKIRSLFGSAMKNFWISSDCKELAKLVEERDKVAMKLEAAETKLIKTANAARLKSLKKGAASHEEENANAPVDLDGESGSAASRWISPKDRPTHKLKPIIGKKVDTINWCRSELERLTPEIEALQAIHKSGEATLVNSIFVEFHTQAEAQSAYQTTTHHHALHMAPRFIGINPNDVIWENLRIKWWERLVRNYATIAFICVLIIFWAVPVAFVGFLSNLNKLKEQYSWMAWLNKVPPVIFGVISGLLPSVLLAVLMALLPIILRLMAKLGGLPSKAIVELRTQNFYFAFQVVQVFLVTTFSSGATAVVGAISKDPSSTPALLAANLPTASNFYISYFLVQGLTISAGALLQIVGLILFQVLGKILDSTPRKMYKRWTTLSGLGWGTVFPIYTLLSVISITYSCIAPLMLFFATIGLWLLYIANRYNLIFVYNATIDTKGLVYPRALQQMTVGIYLAELCMIGLFGVNTAVGPLILMVAFLIFSILFHVSLNNAVGPLLHTIPKSLEIEEQALLAAENAASKEANGSNGATLPPAHKQPSMIAKFLHPEVYCDYQTLRRLVPKDFADITYTPETEQHAYYNPSIASTPPILWIPRDTMGVSRQEVAHSSKVIPVSDEGASFDDKGKITWDQNVHPPIHTETIYF